MTPSAGTETGRSGLNVLPTLRGRWGHKAEEFPGCVRVCRDTDRHPCVPVPLQQGTRGIGGNVGGASSVGKGDGPACASDLPIRSPASVASGCPLVQGLLFRHRLRLPVLATVRT